MLSLNIEQKASNKNTVSQKINISGITNKYIHIPFLIVSGFFKGR